MARPYLSIALIVLLGMGGSAHAQKPRAESWSGHLYVSGAGLALIAGGGVLAYYQNREADRDMAIYRHSGFTENTLEYRRRVEHHEKLTWMGVAGMALGGVLVMISF